MELTTTASEMNFAAAYTVLLTPFILATLGILLCVLLFDVLFVELPLSCIALIVILFLHPVPYYEGFRNEWRIHVRACLERLGLQVVFGGSVTQIHEHGDNSDSQYLVCLHPLGAFNLMGLLLFVHMFELIPTLANVERKAYLFHEERILTLPIVRVFARWLGIHWFEKGAFRKAVDSGAHVVIFPGFSHERLHTQYGEEGYTTTSGVADNDDGMDRFVMILSTATDAGMTILPVYVAGITHMYNTWRWTAPIAKYSISIPYGKWYTLLPRVTHGFTVVCGKFVHGSAFGSYAQLEAEYNNSLQSALKEGTDVLKLKLQQQQQQQCI